MFFCFYPTLKMQIQPLNYLKTVSKVGDLSSTIAMTVHCFGAFSQVRAIWHCVIGQERDLLCPDWLNWWVCPWVPVFEIQIFLTPLNSGTHGQVWGNMFKAMDALLAFVWRVVKRNIMQKKWPCGFEDIFSCDQAALKALISARPSVYLSVRLSIRRLHLFDKVPVIP